MPLLDPFSLTVILIGLAFGSYFKGLTGMGLPMIAVPILAGFLGVEHAIVVMQIPGLVSNIWLVWSHRLSATEIAIRYDLIIPSVITVMLGVWFLDVADTRITILILAGSVAVMLPVLLLKPSFRLDGMIGRIVTIVVSAFGGFTQGAAGISGPLFATLLLSYRLKREAYVFYNGLVFGLFNVFQIGAMIWFDMFTLQRVIEGFLALIPLFIFQYLGMRTMGAISGKMFNALVIAVIVAMEIKLIWDGLGG
jgi:uncharacterized membrane protein YfcA